MADLSLGKSQPPLVENLSDLELQGIIEKPYHVDFPCSTWAVERAVQITTQSAQVSADPLIRDGMALNKVKARSKNKGNNDKKWNV